MYGKPTDLPWGLRIDNPPAEYAGSTHFHPLFLYESLWNLITVGVLLWLWLRYRDRFKKGDFLLMYLVSYPFARFLLEYLRIEVAMAGGVNVSQVFSLAVAIASALILLYRHRAIFSATRTAPARASEARARPGGAAGRRNSEIFTVSPAGAWIWGTARATIRIASQPHGRK